MRDETTVTLRTRDFKGSRLRCLLATSLPRRRLDLGRPSIDAESPNHLRPRY